MVSHTFEKYSLFKNMNNVMDIFGYLKSGLLEGKIIIVSDKIFIRK